LPPAVFSRGYAPYATDFDGPTIPSRITKDDRQMADDFIVAIEDK
jgi:hypothetical protein